MKIFGREPALVIGFAGAVFTAAAALELPWLNAGQAAALTGGVSALIIAYATRPVAPPLFAAGVVAVAAVFAEYGMHWSDAAIGGVSGLILAGFALFGIRPQVTPTADPRTIDGQVVVR